MKYIVEYSIFCLREIDADNEVDARGKFKDLVKQGIDVHLNDDSYGIDFIYPKENEK